MLTFYILADEPKIGSFNAIKKSYYLMKGLEGYADINSDKRITNGELLAYIDQNASKTAFELGREQNATLVGDSNKILISYKNKKIAIISNKKIKRID